MSTEATFAKPAVCSHAGHRWCLFSACVLVSLTNEVSTAVTSLSLGPMRHAIWVHPLRSCKWPSPLAS